MLLVYHNHLYVRKKTWEGFADADARSPRAERTRLAWRATASEGSITSARPAQIFSMSGFRCGKWVQPRTILSQPAARR